MILESLTMELKHAHTTGVVGAVNPTTEKTTRQAGWDYLRNSKADRGWIPQWWGYRRIPRACQTVGISF